MKIDWSRGCYETTASQLETAARRVVEVAAVGAGQRVLDLGCGTGNAALLAAARGARVTAVDPAERLLDAARQRATAAGLDVEFASGNAAAIAAPDDHFDVVVAVFSVIFAPDPSAAATEMMRVLRPGGRAILTSWMPEGAIHELAELLLPPGVELPTSAWHRREGMTTLFTNVGASVEVTEESLAIEASSAQAYFEELETHHPAWLLIRGQMGDQWASVKQRSLALLERSNESGTNFKSTCRYWLVTATKARG
jgi:SAM-dependent methyltransferase